MSFIQREIHKLRTSKLSRNFGWMFVGQGANLLLQAAYFAVLGRLLGSTEYGIFVGAFALTNMLATFSAMGSGTLLVRYVSTDHTLRGLLGQCFAFDIVFRPVVGLRSAYHCPPHSEPGERSFGTAFWICKLLLWRAYTQCGDGVSDV
jgi:hypothetical protein